MKSQVKKSLKFIVRWGIAVGGIWYVLANISLSDRVMMLNSAGTDTQWVKIVGNANEADATFTVRTDTGTKTIARQDVWTPATPPTVEMDGKKLKVLAIQPSFDAHGTVQAGEHPNKLLLKAGSGPIPGSAAPSYILEVPYPLVDIGLPRRLHDAEPWLLWAAVLIFPVTFLVCSLRWHELMKPLEIRMSLARAFTLYMVGNFYNTFMPGSTGGDVLKAYYAAKLTTHRTRAVMSVIVDRVVGLLALILLGGVMATIQYFLEEDKQSATARSCLKVGVLCLGMLAVTIVGAYSVFHPLLRKYLLIDWMLAKLPMQQQVQKAVEAMTIYRQRPLLVFAAIIGTLPVHITVVISAMLAGMAFHLPLNPLYYFVAVPVIVLVGAIPISPQGAGVMEFFAIRLTERHGVTVAQAFILTMAIRLVQIVWNLFGGLFVLKGGFSAPTEKEQQTLDTDDDTVVPA